MYFKCTVYVIFCLFIKNNIIIVLSFFYKIHYSIAKNIHNTYKHFIFRITFSLNKQTNTIIVGKRNVNKNK